MILPHPGPEGRDRLLEGRDAALGEGAGRPHFPQRARYALVLDHRSEFRKFEVGAQSLEIDGVRRESEPADRFDQALDSGAETLAGHRLTFDNGVRLSPDLRPGLTKLDDRGM